MGKRGFALLICHFIFGLAGLALIGALSGCGVRQSLLTTTPIYAENSDVAPALWEKKEDGRQWTLHTFQRISRLRPSLTDLDIKDMDRYCPEYNQFNKIQKLNFWTQLIVAMTKFESDFRTESTNTESFKDQHGNEVVSRGLLQISIGSVENICGFSSAQTLHNPFMNLSCSIRLLHRYIVKDSVISDKVGNDHKGGARYWAVLRTGHDSLTGIQSLTKSFCKKQL